MSVVVLLARGEEDPDHPLVNVDDPHSDKVVEEEVVEVNPMGEADSKTPQWDRGLSRLAPLTFVLVTTTAMGWTVYLAFDTRRMRP